MPLSFNTRYSSAYSSTPGSSQSANRCCAMPDHRDHGSSCTIAVALLLIDTKATNRPDGEHNRLEPLFESNPSRAQGAVMRLDTHVASRNRWTGRHRSTAPSTPYRRSIESRLLRCPSLWHSQRHALSHGSLIPFGVFLSLSLTCSILSKTTLDRSRF